MFFFFFSPRRFERAVRKRTKHGQVLGREKRFARNTTSSQRKRSCTARCNWRACLPFLLIQFFVSGVAACFLTDEKQNSHQHNSVQSEAMRKNKNTFQVAFGAPHRDVASEKSSLDPCADPRSPSIPHWGELAFGPQSNRATRQAPE